MLYPDLSSLQRSQVECLFYDQIFGTDPARYDYEIDLEGLVYGRIPLERETDRKHHQARGAAASMHAVFCEPAPEAREPIERALNDLARMVAMRLAKAPVAMQAVSPGER